MEEMLQRPTGLTDAQIDAVLKAAQRVPATWRTRFVENVVDRVYANVVVTDGDLNEAVRFVAERMHANL